MLPRLQKSEYRGDYRIWLQFADGVEGEIDLEIMFDQSIFIARAP